MCFNVSVRDLKRFLTPRHALSVVVTSLFVLFSALKLSFQSRNSVLFHCRKSTNRKYVFIATVQQRLNLAEYKKKIVIDIYTRVHIRYLAVLAFARGPSSDITSKCIYVHKKNNINNVAKSFLALEEKYEPNIINFQSLFIQSIVWINFIICRLNSICVLGLRIKN